MNRTLHRWTVTLQAMETGEVVEYEVAAYWDPEKENTADGVAATAKAEAWWKSGQKLHFAPISTALSA